MRNRKKKDIPVNTRKNTFHRLLKGSMLLSILFVLFGNLTGCGKDTEIVLTTGFKENEVFRIEGRSCYVPEVMVYLTNIYNQYDSVYGAEIWNQTVDGIPIGDSVKQTVLARIAKIKMMNLLAESYGICLSNEEQSWAKAAASEYYDSLSPEEKQAMGDIDEATIRQLYEEYALANKIYNYLVSDVEQEISDDEARTVTVHQIFIATSYEGENGERIPYSGTERIQAQLRMDEATGKIAAGESFDAVAATYNEAEELTAYYRKGAQEENLVTAVFNLAQGEISTIVEGENGYYLFYCVSTYDMEQTESAKIQILRQRQQEVFNQIYEFFIVDKYCYLNEELWETMEFADSGSVNTSDFFDIYEKYFVME